MKTILARVDYLITLHLSVLGTPCMSTSNRMLLYARETSHYKDGASAGEERTSPRCTTDKVFSLTMILNMQSFGTHTSPPGLSVGEFA